MKIFHAMKLFFLSRWNINIPPQKKILIIDGSDNPFKFFFNRKEYEIIFRRGEEINLYIIFLCIKNFKFSRFDYYTTYINIVRPRIILTYFDHYNFFYKLSKLTKIKTAFVVRGKRSLSDGLFKKKEIKKQNNYVDYMFVHNKNIKKNYEKVISGKVIPIGSFLNNIKRKKQKKFKNKVLWISTFKTDKKDWINPKSGLKFKNSEFQKNDKYILESLHYYLKKNSINLDILGRNNNEVEKDEIKFYRENFPGNFTFISKKQFPNSYEILEKYDYCFTTWSTLGVEKIVKGGRVGFIFNKPKNAAWNGAKLGAIEKFSDKGPFWTACDKNDQKEFERIFHFVLKASKVKWNKARKNYGYQLMEYDEGNSKFQKIINMEISKKY